MLGKERVFINFFSAPTKEFGISEAISDFVGEVPKYLLETLAFACMLGIIIFMVKEGNKVENFLPTLTLYGFAAYRLLPVLQKVFKSVASIKYYFPVLRTISGYFNELPEGESFPAEDLPRMEFSRNISLKNIRFKYPSTHKDIINGQSIDITANTSIAFVGPTGCGKTTLVDILLGLLLPQSGEIYVDDKKIDDANRRSWQKNIGYVPQAIYLADDTIRNNIAFGISPEKIDDEAIIKAAHLANLHDFIVGELEKGYDTIVGERGIRLSGGQRQRIGIARAVYHDPSVLVLDEATSALDGLTENAIMDAIRNMSHRKTIIMIAHRLTTVKSCDRIYIMEKGTILDSGIYDDLYTRNVAFRKMADGSVK
jgi:ABC-type multidrug transport system fused ATPase/permease subunit